MQRAKTQTKSKPGQIGEEESCQPAPDGKSYLQWQA